MYNIHNTIWMCRWMGGRQREIHLPLRPKGFPDHEAEQQMRTKLPKNTDN